MSRSNSSPKAQIPALRLKSQQKPWIPASQTQLSSNPPVLQDMSPLGPLPCQPSPTITNIPTYPLGPLPKKELQDFIPCSILFFERFCPNYGKWLPMNAPWDHIPEFQQDKELVYAIQTVNEPAERMCSILKRFKVLCFWIWTNSHVSDFELPFIWTKLIDSFRILALKSPKHRQSFLQISSMQKHDARCNL